MYTEQPKRSHISSPTTHPIKSPISRSSVLSTLQLPRNKTTGVHRDGGSLSLEFSLRRALIVRDNRNSTKKLLYPARSGATSGGGCCDMSTTPRRNIISKYTDVPPGGLDASPRWRVTNSRSINVCFPRGAVSVPIYISLALDLRSHRAFFPRPRVAVDRSFLSTLASDVPRVL